MTDDDLLAAASEALTAARRGVIEVLVAVAAYIDEKAAAGDETAAGLSRMVSAAFDRLAAENIGAATVLRYPDRTTE